MKTGHWTAVTRQCLGCFASDIPEDNVATSDGEDSFVDSETVNRVVEAGVRHNLVLALAQMEDVDTASLGANVEPVLLAPAQTQHLPRHLPGEDEPGL